jgi:hypothetical protein
MVHAMEQPGDTHLAKKILIKHRRSNSVDEGSLSRATGIALQRQAALEHTVQKLTPKKDQKTVTVTLNPIFKPKTNNDESPRKLKMRSKSIHVTPEPERKKQSSPKKASKEEIEEFKNLLKTEENNNAQVEAFLQKYPTILNKKVGFPAKTMLILFLEDYCRKPSLHKTARWQAIYRYAEHIKPVQHEKLKYFIKNLEEAKMKNIDNARAQIFYDGVIDVIKSKILLDYDTLEKKRQENEEFQAKLRQNDIFELMSIFTRYASQPALQANLINQRQQLNEKLKTATEKNRNEIAFENEALCIKEKEVKKFETISYRLLFEPSFKDLYLTECQRAPHMQQWLKDTLASTVYQNELKKQTDPAILALQKTWQELTNAKSE